MVEKIELENGLTLEIWNYSRKLAGDRWLVGFLVQVGVTPSPETFSSKEYYEAFKEKTDGKVYYRYRKERTFVPEKEVSKVFNSLKENFLKAALPYLSHPEFKERLVRHEVASFEKKVDWEKWREEERRREEEEEKTWNREYI